MKFLAAPHSPRVGSINTRATSSGSQAWRKSSLKEGAPPSPGVEVLRGQRGVVGVNYGGDSVWF
ncbi:MAG: hypothetical protein ACK4SY_02965 [Pyrobaculum sp.]